MPRLRFVTHPTRGKREHKVSEEDVRFVLSRLPDETWSFLREVHFNDRIGQNGCLGYACHRSHSLALCALPPRLSFAHYCHRQECRPEVFGASFGRQWPHLAVRRFILYYVFLHELGHLQPLPRGGPAHRRGIPGEAMAREFAHHWREQLWSYPFAESEDPVHRPPPLPECCRPNPSPQLLFRRDQLSEALEVLRRDPRPKSAKWQSLVARVLFESGEYQNARAHYQVLFALAPPTHERRFEYGLCYALERNWVRAVEVLQELLSLQEDLRVRAWLAHSHEQLGEIETARSLLEQGDPTSEKLRRQLRKLLKRHGLRV